MARSKPPEPQELPLPLAAMRRQAPADEAGLERWPTLLRCLMPIWLDGKCKRQSGSISLRLIGGYYQLVLRCPTEGLETSMVSESLVDLFERLEARLRSPECVWTPDFESQKKTRQVRIDKVD